MSETGPNGKQYKKRRSSTEKARDEWIAVPDSGVPREWVDAAREAIKENRKSLPPIEGSGNYREASCVADAVAT